MSIMFPSAFSTVDWLYVDNLIYSVEDTDLAYIIHKQIKFILGEAGFNKKMQNKCTAIARST